MNIIWLSEIKWNYLKTRKQQIISRFPDDSSILFIEPISKKLSNNYYPIEYSHVKAVTIPQLRSVRNRLSNKILSYLFIRKIINALATLWFRFFFHKIINNANCIITSNVYWSPLIKTYKIKYPDLPIIYDCNDNPLAFPGTPNYKKEYFIETLSLVNKIIIPHVSYRNFIPNKFHSKIEIITNGVDFELFQKINKPIEKIKKIKKPIIIYIGAISEWFDFDLTEYLLNNSSYNFVLIGPVSKNAINRLDELSKHNRLHFFNAINHEEIPHYLFEANVCIIPFIKNELTESVLPNKLFEYSAAGKPSVMTNFNAYLSEFSDFVSITSEKDKFLNKIKNQIENPQSEEKLKEFAMSFDWGMISIEYYDYIKKITEENK
ncbi:MAG: hypothetical protein CMG19_00660 [Candidatus Marinimicrobia bacterium]|nr:hypothetical protein [Candidatus Neomarinimicrobiota bacterium]|tara:strand:+ start:1676 stop:2806 length:1131 start_codon:yes stop_codon:yes gene_type:complete